MSPKNRLNEALAIRGMKQIELAEKTGIDKSSINGWKSQRWQPKSEPLHKMAKVLCVSELWLAGYDVPMERPVAQQKRDQLNDSILQIKSNDKYMFIVNNLVNLDESQLSLVESLITQLIKD